MTNINKIINQLAINNCPIVYFHKDEKYMPANFADMVGISDIYDITSEKLKKQKIEINKITSSDLKLNKPQTQKTTIKDLLKYQLISIKPELIKTIPTGEEIICRTKGIYKLLHDEVNILDLMYIVYFAYNGTMESHIYDQEIIVIRLRNKSDINNINNWVPINYFGSIHGGGLWHIKPELTFEIHNNVRRPVFYSSLESHAMHNKPGTYKRIFRFADDKTSKHKQWVPKKIITMIDSKQNLSTSLFNYSTNNFESNPEIYRFHGVIGNYKQINKIQSWAGNDNYIYHPYFYDTFNMLSFPKYEGGINNLFNGEYSKISKTIRLALFWTLLTILIICICLIYYFLYKAYQPLKKHKHQTKAIFKFSGICIGIFIGIIALFFVNFYVGLDIFIIDN